MSGPGRNVARILLVLARQPSLTSGRSWTRAGCKCRVVVFSAMSWGSQESQLLSQRVGHPRLPIFFFNAPTRARRWGYTGSFLPAGRDSSRLPSQDVVAMPCLASSCLSSSRVCPWYDRIVLASVSSLFFFSCPTLVICRGYRSYILLLRLTAVWRGGSEGLGTIAATARIARQVPLPVVESRVSDFERPITEG